MLVEPIDELLPIVEVELFVFADVPELFVLLVDAPPVLVSDSGLVSVGCS